MGWKTGSVIMQAQPYAHVIMQKYREDRCNFCLSRCRNLKKCAVCKKSWYCGVRCQKSDWKLHKDECPVMTRVPDTPTDSMRLMLRLVIRHLKGASSLKLETEKPSLRSFDDLMSHSENLKADKNRCELFETASDFLSAYTHGLMTLPPADKLLEIFGKMVSNTFTIADEMLQDVAVGIYNSPAILDHRCHANAVATFEGRIMTVRATEHIKDDDFYKDVVYTDGSKVPQQTLSEKVFLCYIDPLAITSERQAQLSAQYYFTCICRTCMSSNGDKLMCSIEGSSEADLDKVKSCLDRLEIMQKDQESPQKLLETCEKCLASCSLPETNVHLVRLLNKGFEFAITGQEFEQAMHLGLRSIKPYESLHPPSTLCVGHMQANLGKLLLYLGKLPEAEEQLSKSKSTIGICLGASHFLMHQVSELLQQCQAEMRNS